VSVLVVRTVPATLIRARQIAVATDLDADVMRGCLPIRA
jgi:hypothetical protein